MSRPDDVVSLACDDISASTLNVSKPSFVGRVRIRELGFSQRISYGDKKLMLSLFHQFTTYVSLLHEPAVPIRCVTYTVPCCNKCPK